MARKKREYRRKPFETNKPGTNTSERFVALYPSMIYSRAFRDLSPRQQVLYMYMKDQLFGGVKDGLPEGQFYFNREKWQDRIRLYSSPNKYYRDRNALIAHGFIEIAINRKNMRQKNVYCYSDKWQKWEPGIDFQLVQNEASQ